MIKFDKIILDLFREIEKPLNYILNRNKVDKNGMA